MSRVMVADFSEALARPVFEIEAPSLAAVVPTAMVLVDYALQGAGTREATIKDPNGHTITLTTPTEPPSGKRKIAPLS